MNKKRLLIAALALGSFGGSYLQAQVVWTAPAAPGQDLSAVADGAEVYVYNIEAEAVLTRGYNWATKAIADQLENGDAAAGAGRQYANIIKDGDNIIKIHIKDRAADVFFGQDESENPAAMWSDLGNAGDRVRFLYEASANYPNAYTLKNIARQQLVDVMYNRGGQATLYGGKGFTDWAFVTNDDVVAGKLRQFKARKAMWGIYKALEKSNALAANATALDAANTVYTNAEASADDLRAAFRTLFLAVAGSIEDPVDASYLFNNPDMAADKTMDSWNWQIAEGTPGDRLNPAFGAGEYERWHAAFTAHQSQEVPNGLYDIRFYGMYRQDEDSNEAPKLIITSDTESTADFANMDQLGSYWNVSNGNDWTNCNGNPGQRPNQMWTASDALALEHASALAENVKVKDGQMDIKFAVSSTGQWFNWHRVQVTYKGAVALALYKSLLAKIAEGEAYTNNQTPKVFMDAIATAVNNAKSLTSESEETVITNAINDIDAALNAAKTAPSQTSIDHLTATIALAEAEGIDASSAKTLVENILTTTPKQIDDALYDLRANRKLNAATKVDVNAIEGSEPANGDYYLLNVGTGLFLNTTADWGCHISIDNPGMLITLTQDGTGTDNIPAFKISGNGWSGLNWNEEYWDKNGEHKSAFRPVAGKEKVYYWNVFDNFRWHFIYDVKDGECDGNTHHWNAVQKREKDAAEYESDLNAQWKLVSKDQLLAYMQKATKEAPVDATFLINNPNFTKFNGQDAARGWSGVGGVINGDRDAFYVVEFFERDADMKQTIEGLPAGIYKVSVNGFYRDGNSDNETKKVNNNQELNHTASLVAINGSDVKVEATLPNVTSGAGTMPGVGEVINGLEIPNWPVQANEYFQSGLYKTTTGSIIVGEDGKLTIGIENANNGTPGNWVVIDNFRLTYFGTQIDLTEFLNALNAAISDAEAFDATTTTAPVANALSQALNDAKSKLTSEVADEITNATNALNTALTNAKAVNIIVLKKTAELAEAEGINVDAARTAIAEATTSAPVDNALNSLRIARRVNAADIHENVFKGNQPAEGDFYLYNVGAKRFLCGGDDWGAHCVVGFPGQLLTFTGTDGNYRIDTHLSNGGNSHYLGYNGYMDTDATTTWTLVSTGKDGVYVLARTESQDDLLGYDTTTYNIVHSDRHDSSLPENQWILVSVAERDALIELASEENPVDLSYKIQAPGFDQRASIDKWAMTDFSIWGRGGNHPDFACESWNKESNKLSQTIEGLPSGNYKVSVQGFFRDGNLANQVELISASNEPAQLASLYAGEQSILLPNIVAEKDMVPGIGVATAIGELPDNCDQACNFFQLGLYKVELDVVVGNDGKLEIGVSKNSKNFDEDWVVVDNFRLVYFGDPAKAALLAAKDSLAALIATAKAIDTTGKTSESATALSNAITNAETALAAENATVESLNAAKTALQNAIDGLKDEVVDGINVIESAAQAGKAFNMQGQQVKKAKKGVYIINNKKVVVK